MAWCGVASQEYGEGFSHGPNVGVCSLLQKRASIGWSTLKCIYAFVTKQCEGFSVFCRATVGVLHINAQHGDDIVLKGPM